MGAAANLSKVEVLTGIASGAAFMGVQSLSKMPNCHN